MVKNGVSKFIFVQLKKIFGIFRDQFVLQSDGYGKVVGRIKDMIIRGGENIYPKEIEDFLNTHPKILDTQVRS